MYVDLFGTNNSDEVNSSIQKVAAAIKAGAKPNQSDLERVEKAAKQAGSTGNQARAALGR